MPGVLLNRVNLGFWLANLAKFSRKPRLKFNPRRINRVLVKFCRAARSEAINLTSFLSCRVLLILLGYGREFREALTEESFRIVHDRVNSRHENEAKQRRNG